MFSSLNLKLLQSNHNVTLKWNLQLCIIRQKHSNDSRSVWQTLFWLHINNYIYEYICFHSGYVSEVDCTSQWCCGSIVMRGK